MTPLMGFFLRCLFALLLVLVLLSLSDYVLAGEYAPAATACDATPPGRARSHALATRAASPQAGALHGLTWRSCPARVATRRVHPRSRASPVSLKCFGLSAPRA